MAEIVRAGLIQQQWTGDKESMIRASADAIGRVDVPQEAFVAALSTDAGDEKPKK